MGTFSAIDLTLSDLSIFIDDNWRVYKDPYCYGHSPIMENSTINNWKPQTKLPGWNFKKKKQTGNHTKNCLNTLITKSDTNQEEPIIHFTNILITLANKTIPPPKHKPWFTEECKNMRMSSNP